MKISETTVFKGPNPYSTRSLIRYLITSDVDGNIPAWVAVELAPLSEAMPPSDRWAAFAKNISQTGLPPWRELFLEIFLRFHELMGAPLDFAEIRPGENPDQWKLLARMRDWELSRCALTHCLRVTNILSSLENGMDKRDSTAIRRKIENVVARAHQEGLNFDSEAFVQEAEHRRIPWRNVGKGILALGNGCLQKKVRSAVTSETSLIGARIAGDKAMTSALLGQIGLPVPKQVVAQSLADAIAAVEQIGFPLVLKPLTGSEGKGVTAGIHDPAQIETAYRRARLISRLVAVERFIPGRDFRILVVDGQVVAAAERVPANVVGNGKSDIQTLVAEENSRPRRDGRLLYKIRLDEAVEEQLGRQGYSLQSVPAEGERVLLRSTANFSTGGVPIDVTDHVHPDNRRVAVRAARAVGLDVAGVDFITPDITSSYNLVGGAICEVNALPGLRLHIAPEKGEERNVVGKIMDMLFPEGSRGSIPATAVFGRHSKQVTAFMLANLLTFCGKTTGVCADRKAYVGGERRNDKRAASLSALADLILEDASVDAAVFEIPFRDLIEGGLGFEPCNIAVLLGLAEGKVTATLATAMQNVLSTVDGTVIVNADDPSCIAAAAGVSVDRLFLVSLARDNAVVDEHVRLGGRALCLKPHDFGNTMVLRQGNGTWNLLEAGDIPVLNGKDRMARTRSAMCTLAAALSMGEDPARLARGLKMLDASCLSAASGIMEFQHNPFTTLLVPAISNGLEQLVRTRTGTGGHNIAIFPAAFLLSVFDGSADRPPDFRPLILHGDKTTRQLAIDAWERRGFSREAIRECEAEHDALLLAWSLAREGDQLTVFSDNPDLCAKRLAMVKSGTGTTATRTGEITVSHPLWTGKELALATGGRWVGGGGENVQATGVCYYSRQLARGDVFITTSPEHWKKDFADTAPLLEKMWNHGAVAAIVDRIPESAPEGLPLLLVDNTREALNQLGRFARGRLKGKAICVTGSAGKSTTKEMLYFVLGRQGLTTASRKNFNHGDGVPLSIAQTPADAAYGVYEFCVDAPAVTLPKAMIARPDVAIVTTVEHDHLMFYKTLEGVADQKSLLFDGLVPGGTAILNRDNPLFDRLRSAATSKGVRKIVSFGTHPEADVRATSFEMSGEGSHVKALVHGTPVEYRLTQPGRHMIMNSLAALAAVEAAGGNARQAAADLGDYAGLSQRVERHHVALENGHFDIIDDSFSANPASIRAGLDVLSLTKPGAGGRRLALLGEIKELGKESPAIHAALADAVKAAGVERLFTIGDDMLHLRKNLPEEILAAHGTNGAELAAAVAAEIRAGDVILVKGSRRAPENTAPTVHALLAKAATGGKKKVHAESITTASQRIPLKASRTPGPAFAAPVSVLWSGEELARATGGHWLDGGMETVQAHGVCFYFNQLRTGDVFITTSKQTWGGAYADNRDCLKDLPSRGAAAAIVDFIPNAAPPGFPLLRVENTRDALDALGRYARQRIKGKVVCVTGSSGKSTTKEALKFVLERQGLTAASRLNFNHDEGVPLSLAQTSADVAYGVYEYAADPPQPGTRPPKYLIARPDVAIVTLIAPDHLMSYQTLEGVAQQKAMLFEGLEPGGCAILNRDDEFFDYLSEAARARGAARIISFGTHPDAEVRALSLDLGSDGSHVRATMGGVEIDYVLALPGRHMVMNSLAVLAAAHALGADVARAAADLGHFRGLPQRTERHHVETGQGSFDLIDDSFSTNPASIRAGLALLNLLLPAPGGRRIAVLGAIKELGESSPQLHASLAQAVLDAGVDILFTVGEDMLYLREALPQAILGAHGSNGTELASAVASEVRAGDVVLVKGSLRSHEMTSPTVKALLDMRKSPASTAGGPVTLDGNQRHDPERLEIVFAGDTSFGENYQAQCEARGQGNLLHDKGYDYPLENMKGMLASADLVVANLETPLTNLERSPFQGLKSFIHWSDIQEAPRHLLRANIRVVGLANNHAFDYGREGFEQTLDTLEHFGMPYFGAGRTPEEACQPLLLEATVGGKSFRLAVVGAFDYSKAGDEKFGCYARSGRGGLCALDEGVMRVIRNLKQNDPECFVIAFPHWGPNYKWKTAMQSSMADQLLLAGADLIIGHGAHMLQEIERRKGKWIVFSIGNFMFNSPGRYKDYQAPPYSLVARLAISMEGDVLHPALELFPVVTDNLRTAYQTRFVSEKEYEEVRALVFPDSKPGRASQAGVAAGVDEFGYFLRLDLRTI